ncbi:MAG: aminotransferase class V-fold PLP-dependent enzyme [Clostridia bacterium]|nr:aminotransferase class V-fold PLP-dependent enzyme [Clostridia bacterium]
MTKEIHYLDNAATTRPSAAAQAAAVSAMDIWGNPSQGYSLGMDAKKLLEDSREAVLTALGVRRMGAGTLVFTASGTEANCMATLGYHYAKNRTGAGKKAVMLLSDGEHPSIENPARILEELGWQIIRIPTVGGELDMDELRRAAATPCTSMLVCFMLVNNETGALYDVKRAAAIVHAAHPDAHVHCDAVQAFMKTKVNPTLLGVDSLTVSAHKIHSIRGAAAFYMTPEVVKRKNITAVIPGGGQEKNYRSGTENLVSIAAFAAACREAKECFSDNRERVESLSAYLKESLAALEGDGIRIKKPVCAVPDVVNITLPRIKSETMLNFLSGKGIYASAGSACSAGSGHLSHALKAFGCADDVIDSSLRISISHTNDESDVDALTDALKEGLSSLARF